MTEDFARRVSGIGALAEPARRALYQYVAAQPDAVSRDQAARATGVAVHTAKFHLDKLVDEGLLATEFRRLSGRTGPGAGRPAKLYRRAEGDVSVSLPERRYDLAGKIFAAAIERTTTTGGPVMDAVAEEAAATGRALATRARTVVDPAVDEGLEPIVAVLAENGYEPREDRKSVV